MRDPTGGLAVNGASEAPTGQNRKAQDEEKFLE